MKLNDSGICLAAFHLYADHFLAPLVEDVGRALEKQHPEDVFLELGGIHLAAQDVGCFEQMAFQLGQCQGHQGFSRLVMARFLCSAVQGLRKICRCKFAGQRGVFFIARGACFIETGTCRACWVGSMSLARVSASK